MLILGFSVCFFFNSHFFKLMKMKKYKLVGRVALLRSHTGKSLYQDSNSDLCDSVVSAYVRQIFPQSEMTEHCIKLLFCVTAAELSLRLETAETPE